MCNPRRIEVAATRQMAESWQHEVRRLATLPGEAVGEARVIEPLDASIGAPTLAALARLLEHEAGWIRDGDTFRHDLDGGYVAYHIDTQEVELAARVTETVSVTGYAVRAVGLTVDETLAASGEGIYYDDGEGNVTAADAERAAAQAAEQNLDALAEERRGAERTLAEQQLDADLIRLAERDAERRLTQRMAERGEDLDATAADRLAGIGIRGRNLFNQVLASAYRDAILAYANARGADRIMYSEVDGIIEIEFELQT